MIEFLFIAVALIGSFIAGMYDLKTTEIPDEIPLLMGVIGFFGWLIYALTFGDFAPFFSSLLFGTAFLLLGWLLYKTGQWGGGDALLLGAIFYLIPFNQKTNFVGIEVPTTSYELITYNLDLFLISYLFNFLIVGIIYTIIYSVFVGLRNSTATKKFMIIDYRKNKPLYLTSVGLFILSSLLSFYFLKLGIMIFLIAGLMIFWRYGKVIEKKIFTKKVKTSKVKVGDVVVDFKKWDGITENQLKELKKKKKFVIIKEGVRFAHVFFIALLVTLLFGNLIFFLYF